MNNDFPAPRQPLLNWWIIWFALLSGLPIFYFVLSSPHSSGADGAGASGGLDKSLWMIGLVPMAMSTVIRWAILPRLHTPQAAQAAFIVGLALSEMCCFLGLFLFPNAKNELFAAAALGMIQFAPFFAAKFHR